MDSIRELTDFYKYKKGLNELINEIKSQTAKIVNQHQEIIFCGCMDFIGEIAVSLTASGKDVFFIDRGMDEGMFYGCPIISLDDIEGRSNATTVFVNASRSNVAFYNKVLKYYCKDPTILSFEQMLLLFGKQNRGSYRYSYTYDGIRSMMEDAYLNENRYMAMLAALEDETSKDILARVLLYRTGFDMKLNEGIKSPYPDYLDESVFHLSPCEIIADVGAFTGDTCYDFLKRLSRSGGGGYQYYFFEPSKANIELAKKYFTNPQIIFVPAALSNEAGTKEFDGLSISSIGKLGGGNFSQGNAATSIKVTTLDSFFENREVTYIKADIEGEEINMLAGGKETIRRNKPKLAICLYHRYSDILDIFELIQDVGVKYRYYIRAHRNSVITEYILYAIPC